MRENDGWSVAVWLGLLLTPLMVACGQVLFKFASARLPEGGISKLGYVMLDPYFIAAMTVYSVATLSWIMVLRTVPLGIAYTFMALGFISVPLVSMYVFGEFLTPRYFIGTLMIAAGLLVIHA